ncbi:MAG TPA: DUF4190 domain-containing protein [Ktedonobacterales bacterium]|nr:DUF4190 domain-containing protein [Ktedonobacterales bacterium]
MSTPYQPNPYGQPGGSDPYQPQTNYSQPYGSQPYGADPYSAPQQPYGSQPYGQAPIQPAYVQPVAVAQPQTNNKALISLILGIVSYVLGLNIIAGIPAIILGHMAMREIDRSGGTQGGKPLALVGLILGYVMVAIAVVGCLFIAIFVLGIFGAAATSH